MTSSATWNYITQEATKVARSWTYKEQVCFHYFNPNGLYARKQANDEKISDLVAREVCRTGAILAYGTLADWETKQLQELYAKSRVNRIECAVCLEMLLDHCYKQEAFIADAEKQAERWAAAAA
jgi:predicted ribosome quality control (RQC) complex YloA/Tae2 family protein